MSDPSANEEKSPALKQLEAEAALQQQREAIAKSQQAIAEARRKKLEAQLPAGAPPAPEGKISTDDQFGYLAELVAYDTLARQAAQIAERLATLPLPDNSRLLLLDDLDVAGGDVALRHVQQQLAALQKAVAAQMARNQAYLGEPEETEILESKGLELATVGAVATAATAVIGAAAGIAAMFQVDYEVKGKSIALPAAALHALLAGRLKKWPVYLPDFGRLTASPVLKALDGLWQAHWTLQSQTQQLRQQLIEPHKVEIARLAGEIKALEADGAKKAPEGQGAPSVPPDPPTLIAKRQEKARLEAEKTAAETALLQSEGLITAVDESVKALVTAPESGAASPLAAAMRRERWESLGITHLLYATVVSSGGEAITSKRWFTSGHTVYLGGSVVTYVLADSEGRLLAADTLVEAGRLEYQLGDKRVPEFGKR